MLSSLPRPVSFFFFGTTRLEWLNPRLGFTRLSNNRALDEFLWVVLTPYMKYSLLMVWVNCQFTQNKESLRIQLAWALLHGMPSKFYSCVSNFTHVWLIFTHSYVLLNADASRNIWRHCGFDVLLNILGRFYSTFFCRVYKCELKA